MSNYNTSQKIAIINEIDEESRELWLMLNDSADSYSEDNIVGLFVDILSCDKSGHTRFNMKRCEAYIENVVNDHKKGLAEAMPPKKFDLLAACQTATRRNQLHSFLFDSQD